MQAIARKGSDPFPRVPFEGRAERPVPFGGMGAGGAYPRVIPLIAAASSSSFGSGISAPRPRTISRSSATLRSSSSPMSSALRMRSSSEQVFASSLFERPYGSRARPYDDRRVRELGHDVFLLGHACGLREQGYSVVLLGGRPKGYRLVAFSPLVGAGHQRSSPLDSLSAVAMLSCTLGKRWA